MLSGLFLSLMPALVILAFRTLCTLRPAPVPKYLERPRAQAITMEEWWLSYRKVRPAPPK
jgi:hypothetical protein